MLRDFRVELKDFYYLGEAIYGWFIQWLVREIFLRILKQTELSNKSFRDIFDKEST